MIINPVFHWSPDDRHKEIIKHGLVLGQKSTMSPGLEEEWALGCAEICFGTSPLAAWNLSGGMAYDHLLEIEAWDLWQVDLQQGDEISFRGEYGNWLTEVRCGNTIPADRVHWVARR